LILYPLVKYVRKNFQWFITPKDEYPEIDKEGLKKFLEHGYDSELGWVRHPGTKKESEQYSINERGARENPGHESLSVKISTYGDSFCFCRQNKDNETWQWFLSEHTKSNVLNFGVGNYGIDQAYLRLKREFPKNKSKVIVMCVVPSTIVRILCVWKHYNEYGNVLGFKPRFEIENGELKEVKNIMDSKDKFNQLNEFLPVIQKHDYFYKTKFKKEMIRFPYIYHILKNSRRNLPLIYYVITKQIEKAMMKIMDINLELRVNLFKDGEATDLIQKIIDLFVKYAKEQNVKPILLIVPQKDDIDFIRRNGHFYVDVFKFPDSYLKVIDMYDVFINFEDIYSDDNKYGGHPNKKGNELIAKEVLKYAN